MFDPTDASAKSDDKHICAAGNTSGEGPRRGGRPPVTRLLYLVLLTPLLCACTEEVPPPMPGVFGGPVLIESSPPDDLSGMRFLDWDLESEAIRYNDLVVPYEMNTELFTDFALIRRAIYVPDGETVSYDESDLLAFPVGTMIAQTFYIPADLRQPDQDLTVIETRVLIHTSRGWQPWPFIWNDAQTDASLELSGDTREISFIDAEGTSQTANYLIPQRNQCRVCHERIINEEGDTEQTPLGVAARNLNRDYDYGEGPQNQLAYMAELGILTGLPADASTIPAAYDFREVEARGLDAVAPEDLELAARSYLDVNCAHCHNPAGIQGVTSRLFLHRDNTDEFSLGMCKRPGSAGAGTGGLTYDVVPGSPDESILVFRIETTEVGAMMPLIGRSLRHTHGTELIRAWVAAMDPVECTTM